MSTLLFFRAKRVTSLSFAIMSPGTYFVLSVVYAWYSRRRRESGKMCFIAPAFKMKFNRVLLLRTAKSALERATPRRLKLQTSQPESWSQRIPATHWASKRQYLTFPRTALCKTEESAQCRRVRFACLTSRAMI